MPKNGIYKISDLYITSWLLSNGLELLDIVPDDEHTVNFLLTLLSWSHKRKRLHIAGKLGKLLGRIKLSRPCHVCGAKTKDRGWFDPARHEVIAVVDAEVRHYEAVVNRVRASLKAALEVAT